MFSFCSCKIQSLYETSRIRNSDMIKKRERNQERTLQATTSNLTTKWLNSKQRSLLARKTPILQCFSFYPHASHASVVSVQLLPFKIDHVCGVAFGNITPPSGPFPVRIHVRATGMNSNTLTARVIHTAGLKFSPAFRRWRWVFHLSNCGKQKTLRKGFVNV